MSERPLVILPVKSFEMAKRRLAGSLTEDQRRELGAALAAHTAWSARDAGADVVVVAGAREVRTWARRSGFAAVAQPESDPGLNGAARFGLAMAPAGRLAYVVHADLPLINAAVLRRTFRLDIPVIAPSHDGGTSLLGGMPPGFRFAYGVGSYARHLAQLPTATSVLCPEFALDLDAPVDLTRAVQAPQGRWLTTVLDGSTPARPLRPQGS